MRKIALLINYVFVSYISSSSRACCLVSAAAVFVFLDRQFGTIFLLTFEALTSRVNSLRVALRAGYLSVRTAEDASEKQSSLKARLRNGLTYLLTYMCYHSSLLTHVHVLTLYGV